MGGVGEWASGFDLWVVWRSGRLEERKARGNEMHLTLTEGSEPVPGYRLIKPLGHGGFGQVWEAEAPGRIRVALKFIRVETGAAEVEERALQTVCRLRHAYLLEMHWARTVGGYLVIAVSLCDGSLLDRFKQCRAEGLPGLPIGELLRYMEQSAEALDYLNAPRHLDDEGKLVGIAHRDIKPQNIFVLEGCAKVADFGLAKILEHSVAWHTGGMTPQYAAPEMFSGEVNDRSDQYSLATTYYQLRTGALPFTGGSLKQLMYGIINEPANLDRLELPEEREIVQRALAKDAADRWPSSIAFVQALRQIVNTAATETVAAGAVEAETGGGRTRTRTRKRENLAIGSGDKPTTFPNTSEASATDWRKLRRIFSPKWIGAGGATCALAVFFSLPFHPFSHPKTERREPVKPVASSPPSTAKPKDAPISQSKSEDPPPISLVGASQAKDVQAAWARHLQLEVEIKNSIGMKLRLIAPGMFTMGSSLSPDELADLFQIEQTAAREHFAGERPRRTVKLTRPYYLGACEVTVGQFREFVNDTGYITEPERDGQGGWGYDVASGRFAGRSPEYHWRNPGRPQSDDHPVVNLTWSDAKAFTDWLSRSEGRPYRLPTEAEWEYACRAGSNKLFQNGDDQVRLVEIANVADASAKRLFSDWSTIDGDDGFAFSAPVGRFPANGFGVHDMHGNVTEWCSDWYLEDYYATAGDVDPAGPADGDERAARGGSWADVGSRCRSAFRFRNTPDVRNNYTGFRCWRSNKPEWGRTLEGSELEITVLRPVEAVVEVSKITAVQITSSTGKLARPASGSLVGGLERASCSMMVSAGGPVRRRSVDRAFRTCGSVMNTPDFTLQFCGGDRHYCSEEKSHRRETNHPAHTPNVHVLVHFQSSFIAIGLERRRRKLAGRIGRRLAGGVVLPEIRTRRAAAWEFAAELVDGRCVNDQRR